MVVRIQRVVGLPVIVLGLLGGCKRSAPPIAKTINAVPSAAAHGVSRPAVPSMQERAKAPGQSGHCDSLGERLEQSELDGELWRFADIGGEGGPAKWARVSSWKDAESKAPNGNVWSSATVVSDGKWLLAYSSFFSPSGDSAVFTKQCYRPDGTLARIEDSFRTFATAQGLGQDTRVTVFDEKGNSDGGIRKTYLVESGQQLDPNEMIGSANSTPTKRISSLPYFTLLPSEVRSKY